MRYQPYKEIIDIRKELKEYKRLCRGESKEFITYTNWKSHILSAFSVIKSKDQLSDLKHYLVNYKRIEKNNNIIYVNYTILFLTISLTYLFNEFKLIVFLIEFIVCTIMSLVMSDSINKEYCFYCDMIEIIKEIEREKGED